MKKRGNIVPNGVKLEPHEYDTILFLTNLGYKIELIPPSHVPNRRTPDFKMDGKNWEMKCPKGDSRSTIEHAFQSARKQSDYILFDLRRTKIPDEKAITQLAKLKSISKGIKGLKVINKKKSLLDL